MKSQLALFFKRSQLAFLLKRLFFLKKTLILRGFVEKGIFRIRLRHETF